MAPRKQTTELANYDAEFAKLAQLGAAAAKARAGVQGKSIGTQGGRYTIDGVLLKSPVLDVVVEDFVLMNTLYTPGKKFDPKNPDSPICYAFGRTEEEMVPHPESTAPQGGDSYKPKGETTPGTCADCWANQWESAEKGKGKACQNKTRLGLITADSIKSADSIKKADVRFIGVPVMSGKAWAAHHDEVVETFGAVQKVVTKMEIEPQPETGGFALSFSTEQEIDKGLFGAIIAKHQEVAKGIDFPFMKPSPAAPPKKGAGRGAPAKTPAKTAGRPSSKAPTADTPARKTKY